MSNRPAVLALLVVATAACSDDRADPTDPAPPPTPPLSAETCTGARTLHAGEIGNATWRAADNPHAVVDTLRVNGVLTVEAGVEVCIEPEIPILVGNDGGAVHALGTAEDSILLTAGDPTLPWGGIVLPLGCTQPTLFSEPCTAGASWIEHARIEHAVYGIHGGFAATIRNSHVRQIRCTGVSASHIAHTRVDTAGIDGCPAVEMGQAAVRGLEDIFIENSITGSGGDGVYFYDDAMPSSGRVRGRISIVGGRIVGSRGTGLAFAGTYVGGLEMASPIRITGGEAAAFEGPWEKFKALWPSAAALDSIRGNAADSVWTWEVAGENDDLTIPSGLAFLVRSSAPVGMPWAELRSVEVHPGSTLRSRTPLFIGILRAEGTPDAPVRISGEIATGCGLRMAGCEGASRLAHAEMEDVQLHAATPIRIDSVVVRRGSLLFADSVWLTGVAIEDAEGDAIAIGPTSLTTIIDCRIVRSAGAGILVFENARNVTVNDCALEQNAGPGIRNLSADTVDARSNWWGDQDGPLGGNGDGVEGNVDYSDHLNAPPHNAAAVSSAHRRGTMKSEPTT